MRILILGGTGMFGHKLWQRLGARFPDTRATIRGRRADYRRFGIFDDPRVIENVDVTVTSQLFGTLDEAAPNVIVNCVALTKRRESAFNPIPSIELNAIFPHRLAAWAKDHGARLITVSTDCVFDGKKGGYTEEDAPNAWDIYGRTKALGEIVDGNDAVAIWNATQRAIQHARNGHGPSLIECKTFRMTGHSAHDDAAYVPKELFEYWETRDPIRRLEKTLLQQNVLTAAGIAEMEKGINAEIDEAIAIAENDPYPEPEECLRDVYFEE